MESDHSITVTELARNPSPGKYTLICDGIVIMCLRIHATHLHTDATANMKLPPLGPRSGSTTPGPAYSEDHEDANFVVSTYRPSFINRLILVQKSLSALKI